MNTINKKRRGRFKMVAGSVEMKGLDIIRREVTWHSK
jgi:hypothetical protein